MDIHEEEPCSQKERDRQDDWWELYNKAIKAGFSEDWAMRRIMGLAGGIERSVRWNSITACCSR
jgi:hypothetical protein